MAEATDTAPAGEEANKPLVVDIGIVGPVNGMNEPDPAGSYMRLVLTAFGGHREKRLISLGAADVLKAELTAALAQREASHG